MNGPCSVGIGAVDVVEIKVFVGGANDGWPLVVCSASVLPVEGHVRCVERGGKKIFGE